MALSFNNNAGQLVLTVNNLKDMKVYHIYATDESGIHTRERLAIIDKDSYKDSRLLGRRDFWAQILGTGPYRLVQVGREHLGRKRYVGDGTFGA